MSDAGAAHHKVGVPKYALRLQMQRHRYAVSFRNPQSNPMQRSLSVAIIYLDERKVECLCVVPRTAIFGFGFTGSLRSTQQPCFKSEQVFKAFVGETSR